jgi:hypothetical protein
MYVIKGFFRRDRSAAGEEKWKEQLESWNCTCSCRRTDPHTPFMSLPLSLDSSTSGHSVLTAASTEDWLNCTERKRGGAGGGFRNSVTSAEMIRRALMFQMTRTTAVCGPESQISWSPASQRTPQVATQPAAPCLSRLAWCTSCTSIISSTIQSCGTPGVSIAAWVCMVIWPGS